MTGSKRPRHSAKRGPDAEQLVGDASLRMRGEEPPGDAEAVAAQVETDGPRTGAGTEEADEVLAEVEAATDVELDAIVRDYMSSAPAAPEGTTALARRDPLSAYMAEVRRYPLLTREEEYELAVRWVEHGDMEAAKRLVTSNLRLVVKIAHQYRRAYQNRRDLVQEGNVGLVKAVQRFDPYRGVKVSTYAAWWIKAYMLKYILSTWRLVKIGTTQSQRKLFFNLRKQQERLRKEGVDATPERIAKALDVSPAEVVEMQRRLAAPDLSLDAPVGSADGGEGSRTRLDFVEDENDDPEDTVENAELRELLQEKLRHFGAELSGRELEIFEERLIADDPVTLQALGERWGVSRERARQVEKRMVLRLREYLQSELGDTVQVALGH